MPALGRDVKPTFAAGRQQLFVKPSRVVEQNLVSARKQQRRRKIRQIAEQRRAEGIFCVVRVAGGIEVQKLLGKRRIVVAIFCKGFPRLRQIGPRGNADKTARQRQLQRFKLQAQRVNQSPACRLAAKKNLVRRIALGKQVLIAHHCIVQRRREPAFRRQPVCRAEHAHAALVCQRRGKALGVFQIAAGVAAAVQV